MELRFGDFYPGICGRFRLEYHHEIPVSLIAGFYRDGRLLVRDLRNINPHHDSRIRLANDLKLQFLEHLPEGMVSPGHLHDGMGFFATGLFPIQIPMEERVFDLLSRHPAGHDKIGHCNRVTRVVNGHEPHDPIITITILNIQDIAVMLSVPQERIEFIRGVAFPRKVELIASIQQFKTAVFLLLIFEASDVQIDGAVPEKVVKVSLPFLKNGFPADILHVFEASRACVHCHRDIKFRPLKQGGKEFGIINPHLGQGRGHLAPLEPRVIDEREGVDIDIQFLGDPPEIRALRVPVDGRVEEEISQAQFRDLFPSDLVLVLAGDGLQDAALVEAADQIDRFENHLHAVLAIVADHALPESVVQIPCHAFHFLRWRLLSHCLFPGKDHEIQPSENEPGLAVGIHPQADVLVFRGVRLDLGGREQQLVPPLRHADAAPAHRNVLNKLQLQVKGSGRGGIEADIESVRRCFFSKQAACRAQRALSPLEAPMMNPLVPDRAFRRQLEREQPKRVVGTRASVNTACCGDGVESRLFGPQGFQFSPTLEMDIRAVAEQSGEPGVREKTVAKPAAMAIPPVGIQSTGRVTLRRGAFDTMLFPVQHRGEGDFPLPNIRANLAREGVLFPELAVFPDELIHDAGQAAEEAGPGLLLRRFCIC